MIIDELIAVLGYDIRGEANLTRFNAGLERAAATASRLGTMMAAAGTVAAGAMVALGKSVVGVSAKFEGFETSLITIEGSSEKAKASMDWISKFAATTPYELEGITDAFIKLRAYGFDPMDGTLATLGDTASAMNKPLNQAVEAFSDAATFQFERLKEFGIKSSQSGDQVTFTWQQNGKELTKTLKKNGTEITKFLLETFGNRFNGAMVRQSKTWNGMMSNLGDSWTLFQKRIGDKGFFEVVKNRLADLLDSIGMLDADGSLDRWAQKLSDILTSGFNVLATTIERVVLNVGTLIRLIGQAGQKIADFLNYLSGGKIKLDEWQALVLVFGSLLAVLKPAWVVMALFALAIDDFLTYVRGGKSALGDFINTLAKFFDAKPEAIARILRDIGLALAGLLIAAKIAAGVSALAAAFGLLGGAQAAAGMAAIGAGATLSMAGGLLALAAASGAAALSINALWDAIKEDKGGLNQVLGDGIGWAIDQVANLMGHGPNSPENKFAAPGTPITATGKGTPMSAADRAREADAFSTEDVEDYKLELQRKETERVFGKGRQRSSPTEQFPGKAKDDIVGLIGNMNAHLAKMANDAISKTVNATVTDARQDNRQFPVNTSVVINQTVSGATAPAAAAAAVTGAIKPARIEGSPAL